MSLRNYLAECEKQKSLIHIYESLDPIYEIPKVINNYDTKGPILFENVKGFNHKIVANVCSTRQAISNCFGIPQEKLHECLSFAKNNSTSCSLYSNPNMKPMDNPSLYNLPVLTHYAGEQGPYITSGLVCANNPSGEGRNVSYHRIDVLGRNKGSICIQEGHLAQYMQIAKEEGKEFLDVSISIGNHPALMMAAALRPPLDVSEYDVASTLIKGQLELFSCPNVDSVAPSSAEIVLEGRISTTEKASEGPYICITGIMKERRLQPILEIVGIIYRENFIYQGLLAASHEHRLLEGIPNEVNAWEAIKKLGITTCGINMTSGGSSWLHCIVAIEKTNDKDPVKTIDSLFNIQPALKHVVIVDSDIDVYSIEQVEWALATRFQGDKNLIIKPNTYASRLDPSSNQENKKGCKIGFDATIPIEARHEPYIKGKIP